MDYVECPVVPVVKSEVTWR